MKKMSHAVLILILTLVLALSGCGGNPGGSSGYTGVAFTMILVPSQSYEIAQTEVTYELWYAVKTWAVANKGYTFTTNAGREGSSTNSDVPTAKKLHPVTCITWCDAIVWCNALTEYYAAKGGTGYQCVYYSDSSYQTPIRNVSDIPFLTPYIYSTASGNQDMPGCIANGFRLPTSDEWYQAARYIDGTNCYPDNYASGADAAYDAITASTDIDDDDDYNLTSDVAIYSVNSGGSTKPVKSKSPNKLGLYDMSGNVWELCFNYTGPGRRIICGGSWQSITSTTLQLCYSGFMGGDGNPYSSDNSCGFRPVRTK